MSKYLDKLKSLTFFIPTHLSDRVEEQRRKHAADLVQPHIYDRTKRRLVLNEDFIKLYPDKVRYYATEEQIKKEGYPKLAETMKRQKETEKQIKEKIKEAEFKGQEKEGIRKVINL